MPHPHRIISWSQRARAAKRFKKGRYHPYLSGIGGVWCIPPMKLRGLLR